MPYLMFQPRTKPHSTDALPYVSAKNKTPQYWCPTLCFSQGQNPTVLMSYLMFQPRTKPHSTDVLLYVSAKDKTPQYWCPTLCFSQGQNPTVLMSYFKLQPRTERKKEKKQWADILHYTSAKRRQKKITHCADILPYASAEWRQKKVKIIIIGNLQSTFGNSKHFTVSKQLGVLRPKQFTTWRKTKKCANTHSDANQWHTSIQNKN